MSAPGLDSVHNDAAAPVCTVHGSAGFATLRDASTIKKPVRFARCARRWERISPTRGALCAGRCTLGRVFGLREAAQQRTWRYVIAHCMRDQVHVTNSWQSSRTCPVLMLLVLRMR